MTEYQPKTSRDLLLDLGVGSFNTTMLVQTMMMAPSVTEAASAPVMLLVQHIQTKLRRLGAPGIKVTGIVDPATDAAMTQIVGARWLHRTWFDVSRELVAFERRGGSLAPRVAAATKSMGLFDLPDVPGGAVTYAVGAYLLYRVFKKKRS